jgi:uncharacterized coiled-coil protein SlyX
MARPATELERETPVEDRIARLESDVAHIKSDVSEMKAGLRQLNATVYGVKDSVASLAVKIEKYRGVDRAWWLLIAGTILGVMARGFQWI